jgi:hypothetical protein
VSHSLHYLDALSVVWHDVEGAHPKGILGICLIFNLVLPWQADNVVGSNPKRFSASSYPAASSDNPNKRNAHHVGIQQVLSWSEAIPVRTYNNWASPSSASQFFPQSKVCGHLNFLQ